jgi:formylglycine-generating enzyme required for sulfatase activity
MSDPMDPFAFGGDWFARLERRVRESVDEDFVALVKLAQLDPTVDLRFGDFSGVDFSGCNLAGCDFTGANLTGSTFRGASIMGAKMLPDVNIFGAPIDVSVPDVVRFDRAQLRREQLREALNWGDHQREWQQPKELGGDQHLPDLAVFSDAPFAPELVVLPAAEFMMGSPDEEEAQYANERPRHRVTIDCRFAIGRFPVCFAEYDRFCENTGSVLSPQGHFGRTEKPKDEGWGRGRRPVINVSWNDAQKYCDWLSNVTGMTGARCYRLASEAEWEYACRAGTTTRYSWGDAITPKLANYDDARRLHTSELGTYSSNPWGLCDMHGNVWEWVADNWHDSYKGAPEGGWAWIDNRSRRRNIRVRRGGGWVSDAAACRSASRDGDAAVYRGTDVGFRVARTLISS